MAFRLIPKEERFYADFMAIADELKRGAAARGDARDRSAGLGQGRGDQGSRAQVRFPHPRGLPSPAPDVRHAARPRGHPRARPVARRRDGRDRRDGASSVSTGSSSATAPANSRGSSPTPPTRSAQAMAGSKSKGVSEHWSRSTGSRTRRTGCTRGGQHSSTRRRTRSWCSSGRRSSTRSRTPPTAARTWPT